MGTPTAFPSPRQRDWRTASGGLLRPPLCGKGSSLRAGDRARPRRQRRERVVGPSEPVRVVGCWLPVRSRDRRWRHCARCHVASESGLNEACRGGERKLPAGVGPFTTTFTHKHSSSRELKQNDHYGGRKQRQLCAVDRSARGSMKSAASCVM